MPVVFDEDQPKTKGRIVFDPEPEVDSYFHGLQPGLIGGEKQIVRDPYPVATVDKNFGMYGGLGARVPSEVAQEISAQRIVRKARDLAQDDLFLAQELGLDPKVYGNLVSANTPISKAMAVGRGIVKGGSLGTLTALQDVIENKTMNPQSYTIKSGKKLEERNPELVKLGELAGSLLPIGGAANAIKSGTGLLSKIGKAALAGFGIGATSGASRKISEQAPYEVKLKDVAASGLSEGITGSVLSGLAPVALEVPGVVSKVGRYTADFFSPAQRDALQRALRFEKSLGKRVPQVIDDSLDALTSRGYAHGIEDLDSAILAAKNAKRDIWQDYKNLLTPNQNSEIDLSKKFYNISDEVINKNPGLRMARKAQDELPKIKSKIEKLSAKVDDGTITQAEKSLLKDLQGEFNGYNSSLNKFKSSLDQIDDLKNIFGKKMDLEDAENQIQIWNSELESLMKQRNITKKTLPADPVLDVTDKFRQGLKDELLSKLESLTGKDKQAIQRLRSQYGSLIEFEEQAVKRNIVNNRQAPVNLPQSLMAAEGMAEGLEKIGEGETLKGLTQMVVKPMVATKAKMMNDPNELIRVAFKEIKPKGAVRSIFEKGSDAGLSDSKLAKILRSSVSPVLATHKEAGPLNFNEE